MSIASLHWKNMLGRDGAAPIGSVFPVEEISWLFQQLEDQTLRRSRAGIRHALKHPAIKRLATNPQLMDTAETALGVPATPFRAILFDKSAGSNWLVVWHQDTALPLKARVERKGWGPWSLKDGVHYALAPVSALEQVIALRVHLDPSTEKNGPLRILPGTHTLGVLSDDEVGTIAQTATAPITFTANVGDVIAMQPLVIHSSQKSTDDTPRRVLHIEYATRMIFDGLELAVS